MKVVMRRRHTEDVITRETESVDFSSLFLNENILRGLKECGYKHPSPIQLKAIPLGRLGLDLIAQAKSGTGKTCVFSVIALESINVYDKSPQVLIVAPTREIALQIVAVIREIGKHYEGMKCEAFIGGLPVQEDLLKLVNCQIAVGTPGRIKALIADRLLDTASIRLFIVDEADKLFEDNNFQPVMNYIYLSLPKRKQMCTFSATYSPALLKQLKDYMQTPHEISLTSKSDPTLKGVKEYYVTVVADTPDGASSSSSSSLKVFEAKKRALAKVLSSVVFHQCVVFCNSSARCDNVANTLSFQGFPAVAISGALSQEERCEAMDKTRAFEVRVLVSTDLTARGIDVSRVNVVINLDLPRDTQTYLHRIGRTGRFGTFGIAISIVSEEELKILREEIRKFAAVVAASGTNEGDNNNDNDVGTTEASTAEINQQQQQQHFSELLPLPDNLNPEEYVDELENEEEKTKLEKFEKKREETLAENPAVDEVEISLEEPKKHHHRHHQHNHYYDYLQEQQQEQKGETRKQYYETPVTLPPFAVVAEEEEEEGDKDYFDNDYEGEHHVELEQGEYDHNNHNQDSDAMYYYQQQYFSDGYAAWWQWYNYYSNYGYNNNNNNHYTQQPPPPQQHYGYEYGGGQRQQLLHKFRQFRNFAAEYKHQLF